MSYAGFFQKWPFLKKGGAKCGISMELFCHILVEFPVKLQWNHTKIVSEFH